MHPFKYSKAGNLSSALRKISEAPATKFLAGGTNLLDLMKEHVERPEALIDIADVPLNDVQLIKTGVNAGGISLGALAKNTTTANHPLVRKNLPLLSQAVLAGASAQIRNMATNGGNLNQRTRCTYFYDIAMPCNKREPGSGCGALEGVNRIHAIFGWSEQCVAVHPSDMCIASAALDAVVNVKSSKEERSIPFIDYHRLPGDMPQKDNHLENGELLTSIEIPPNNFHHNSYYLKVRDRSSYAFALVSVAVALEITDNKIKKARLALGGVAHKPWGVTESENYLSGKTPNEASFKEAAQLAVRDAKPLSENRYKVELLNKAIVLALLKATKGGTHS